METMAMRGLPSARTKLFTPYAMCCRRTPQMTTERYDFASGRILSVAPTKMRIGSRKRRPNKIKIAAVAHERKSA